MLQQRRHVVVDPMPAQPIRLDHLFKIRQAAHIHANFYPRLQCRQPPRLRRAHGHAQNAQALRIHFPPLRQVIERAELVEHHHSVEHSSLPKHLLERVFFSRSPNLFVLALAKAPAINRQRHHPFLRAHGRVRRSYTYAFEQHLFAQVIHSTMPMDVQQPRRALLSLVRNQQKRGNRLHPVQIQHQPLQRVALMLFAAHQLRWPRHMLRRKIPQQTPQLLPPLFLPRRKRRILHPANYRNPLRARRRLRPVGVHDRLRARNPR